MVTMHDKAHGRIFLAGRRPGELAERLSQRLGISLSVWGRRPACETLRTGYSHSISVISALSDSRRVAGRGAPSRGEMRR